MLFTEDFPGTVLHIRLPGKRIVMQHQDHVIIEAQAGENWDDIVQWTVENGWGGLENLSLIPGQTGTSPIQNIGAYGVEIKDVFHSLDALDKKTGKLQTFAADECDFGYRYSIFKGPARDRFIIMSVQMKLTSRAHKINIGYGAIAQELELMQVVNPSVAEVRTAICNIRNSKLPDPKVTGNAGSFFKNPVVSHEFYNTLIKENPGVVAFPAGKDMKLAAGWLIEKAGWKGYRKGDAGVHQQQALVLVNHGNASGKEIVDLAMEIQKSVKGLFDVHLEPEVNIM